MRRPFLLLLACCLGCSGGDRPPDTNAIIDRSDSRPTAALPSVSAWTASEDGTLSLRITAPETQLQPTEPILIIAELRNDSEKPVEVLRPFGDPYGAVAAGVEMHGPTGKIDHSGATPTYQLGSDAFHTLQPNDIIQDRLELTVDDFAASDAAGRYTLRYKYIHEGYQQTAARYGFEHLWRGEIEGAPVTLLKSEAVKDRAERFKDNVSIVFTKNEYTFRIAKVARGVQFKYEIVVHQDFNGVIPLPQDVGSAQGPGPSGLYPFEAVIGSGHSYSLLDIGLGPPSQLKAQVVKKGRYPYSFAWDGKNWGGPSDTDVPKGNPFPPGTYAFRVRLVGEVVTPDGNKPYAIAKTAQVILKR